MSVHGSGSASEADRPSQEMVPSGVRIYLIFFVDADGAKHQRLAMLLTVVEISLGIGLFKIPPDICD